MALTILVDEAVRRGMPLGKALEAHEEWAEVTMTPTGDPAARIAAANDRAMRTFMREMRG